MGVLDGEKAWKDLLHFKMLFSFSFALCYKGSLQRMQEAIGSMCVGGGRERDRERGEKERENSQAQWLRDYQPPIPRSVPSEVQQEH
jgi:hypothetical protein